VIRGLDLFKAHFVDFSDHYVLIGGAASDLIMTEAGVDFRATKDLDIVLCIEVLDAAFAEAFWGFIRSGGYEIQERSSGKKVFYRFMKPANADYPVMLELFSRNPEGMVLGDDSHLTPIPIVEDVSSLSAILLDEDYYGFLHGYIIKIDGVPVIKPECIVPLKAKAWLDLSRRKEEGESIDSKDIKKHKNDVFRLFQIMSPEMRIDLPEEIAKGMRLFLSEMEKDAGLSLKPFGLPDLSVAQVVEQLRIIYGLGDSSV
jgi:hypothetical protein